MADLELNSIVDSQAEGRKRPLNEGEEGVDAEGTETAAKKLRAEVAGEDTRTPDAAEAGNLEETLEDEAAEAGKPEETLEDEAEKPEETLEDEAAEAVKGEGEKEEEEEEEEEKGIGLGDGESKDHPTEAKIGPKVFTSSVDMFNFFYDLLRNWPINFNVNKYEHLMLEELINKGHQDPQKKIGAGVDAFQVRINPEFYSRCYYIIRKDGSTDDFSYRKCVNNILPLPEDFKGRFGDGKANNKHKGQGGYRGQHGNRGRGGRFGGGRGHGRGNHGRGGGRRY